MISNERPSPYRQWSNLSPKPHVVEDTLETGTVQIERKTFVFSLKENPRGRLLRITEDIGGRRNSIIVPATGLVEFKRLLEEMIKASEARPDPEGRPTPQPD